MRSEFEKLPEIADKLHTVYFDEQFNTYFATMVNSGESVKFVQGAWMAYQEQQKRITQQYIESQNTSKAAISVINERHRQLMQEGYLVESDDNYKCNELTKAAICYASNAFKSPLIHEINSKHTHTPSLWPWGSISWKPKNQREDLVRAAALLIAEIERIDRFNQRNKELLK